ncbi:DNA fragmentation factor subunit alpha-like isoform X1 [Phymastichus coffea]|uniref:DNA fragmentation factor subunit alpha-like isoform X1 n=1 Tax=Phymastichus coffea TaxID=108790 RepID=UPI00273CE23D|nr:DNA fragmentation factor subunit alpha-like isoform X1 [Phymastichus coffea]XP_058798576.1 DNA fragmentation factor subunit alpha-like isoform X1 [Phymastichus coffea]XP_058798585.1 DNA fragmentation factor subunit alpha-like isoform X1 [Phymastichus coffea]
MSDDSRKSTILSNSYKLVDHNRENKKGITASSFKELIYIARTRFEIPIHMQMMIVLEQDGTEIDDEDYFATLESNTILMILQNNQKWTPVKLTKSKPQLIVVDDTIDHGLRHQQEQEKSKYEAIQMDSILSFIRNDISDVSLLNETELEMLSDMNPDSVADIISDKSFLEQLKEASSRFLAKKRHAQESMALLCMYSINAEVEQS